MKPWLKKIMDQVREENPEPLYENIDNNESLLQKIDHFNLILEKTIEKAQEKYKDKYGEEYVFKAKRRP